MNLANPIARTIECAERMILGLEWYVTPHKPTPRARLYDLECALVNGQYASEEYNTEMALRHAKEFATKHDLRFDPVVETTAYHLLAKSLQKKADELKEEIASLQRKSDYYAHKSTKIGLKNDYDTRKTQK